MAEAPALPLSAAALDAHPEAAALLRELMRKGIPENTLRAYASDMAYLSCWKELSGLGALRFPEDAQVVRRFILEHHKDHSAEDAAADPDSAAGVAAKMIARSARRSLDAPSPNTLKRRISGWRALHSWADAPGPFDDPAIKRELRLAVAALSRPKRGAGPERARAGKARHSQNPITADLLEELMDAAGSGLRGLRDRALLAVAFDSGGRRRSEIAGLHVEDIDVFSYDVDGRLLINLLTTKTTRAGETPALPLNPPGSTALMAWLDAAGITKGAVFRPITRGPRGMEEFGKVQPGPLTGKSVNEIIKRLLVQAGYPRDYASSHGIRSGFISEASRQGVALQAAMRLSLHKSVQQAAEYYDDADVRDNPAAALRGASTVSDGGE